MLRLKNVTAAVLIAVMTAYILICFIPVLLGFKCYAVTTGSMGKTLPAGSLALTKKCSFDDIQAGEKVGDIIVFSDTDRAKSFAHRVISKSADNEKNEYLLYTRGDANTADDPYPTQYKYVVGKVVFSLPFIGWLSIFVNSPFGIIIAITALIIFIVLELFVIRGRRKCQKGQ